MYFSFIGIRRIYRATVDGFSSDEYLSKVPNYYHNLLTVVKTADGSVFGGYIGSRLHGEYGEYDYLKNRSCYKYREYITPRPDKSYNWRAHFVYGYTFREGCKYDTRGLDPYFRTFP